jgi:hypothetical protein
MAQLQLDISLDRTPPDGDGGGPHVVGRVRRLDGTEATFVGWIGLLSLLQDAVGADGGAAVGVVEANGARPV